MLGPIAFDGFADLITDGTRFILMVIGVISRLCSCLIVLRFVMSEVKLVGFVKCLLKELAIYLLEEMLLLLNLWICWGQWRWEVYC